MSLQGPIVLVSDRPDEALADELAAHGGIPIVECSWADAATTILSTWPAAVIVNETPERVLQGTLEAIDRAVEAMSEPYMPVLARTAPGLAPAIAGALPISLTASAPQIAARLSSALRVRILHATVFRRAALLKVDGGEMPVMPASDPLDEATVLVAGRGRTFPELTTAIGERMGLIGCLSVETAARYLRARTTDGVVIGDGFSKASIDALLTALGEHAWFRNLPIVLPAGAPIGVDCSAMPNCERIEGDALGMVAWITPLVRLHAYETRLQRQLKAIEAKGMLDPHTGLFTVDAFLRDLNRAVEAAKQQRQAISLARYSFLPFVNERAALDAARLIKRLVRSVDFACRAGDGSILLALPNTELQGAQIVARRIANGLKGSMLSTELTYLHNDPMIKLTALEPSDTAATLLQRIAEPVELATA